MQLPNVTLLLQMLHFFMVCLILRKFVFSPALHILIMKNNHETNMQKNIQTWQFEYDALVKQSHEKWILMKQFLLRLIPSVSKQYPIISDKHKVTVVKSKLSDHQRETLKRIIQDSVSDIV